MKKLLLASTVAAALSAPVAQVAYAADASPHTITGNVGLVTDYKFRGLSQTYKGPALQGGFDYSHASGLYVGTWASNVSGNQFPNGNSLELDIYGGYKWTMGGVGLDVGVLQYYYPGAHYNIAGPKHKYDTTELYIAGSYKWFSAKYSHSLTDLFGQKTATIGGFTGIESNAVASVGTPLPATGNSRGSGYLDLNATFEIGDKLNLVLHYGHQTVKGFSALNYSDYKIGLTKEWQGFTWGAAYVATDAEKRFYRVTPITAGTAETKAIGEGAFILSVAKTF